MRGAMLVYNNSLPPWLDILLFDLAPTKSYQGWKDNQLHNNMEII